MGLTAEQNQQEIYKCAQCDLKFRNHVGLSHHLNFSKIHAAARAEKPPERVPSPDVQDNAKYKSDQATPPGFSDPTSPDPSLDELIYAEWNDEFIEKHFPAAYAAGARYITNASEMPADIWISLMSSPPDFSKNSYDSFVASFIGLPESATNVNSTTD
ncbi:uncharacterized protein BT62DRAFT_1079901 [Guyanagaster necrorhizus]|uniref:C2H2-type domain-containing protein n=1 Tax=Guyanagaster necrorhizus TaxID=856835 RepID=A0A9P7VIL9_9AGAR|nr:uncharacterized protein BT62DRAFT_1079901 [Guyanagaster necrorhizus MCA 3950]KAG7441748.1 hypothetical protein BT62DRAFT_1079901 [Guyanagaster necrorhizus MCA 3950]